MIAAFSKIIKFILGLSIISSIIYLIAVALIDYKSSKDVIINKPTPINIVGNYQIDGGEWHELKEDTIFDSNDYYTITVRGHFSENIPVDKEVLLYIRNLYVDISINGNKVYTFGNKNSNIILNSPGIGMGRFNSNGISTLDMVEITMSNAYVNSVPSFMDLLNNIKIGHYAQLYEQMFAENGSNIIIGGFVIFLGLIFVLLSFMAKLYNLVQSSKSLAWAFFTTISGVWILYESNFLYLPVICPSPLFASTSNILSLYLLPIATICIILSYVGEKQKKLVEIITFLPTLLVAVMIVLQLFGLIQLYEFQDFFIIISLLAIISSIALIAYDGIKNNIFEIKLMFVAVFPILGGNIWDAIRYFATKESGDLIIQKVVIITLIPMMTQIMYFIKLGSDTAKRAHQLENELAQEQISIMLSQIQPHFLFNTLAAIKGLCRSDALLAENALVEFSNYLRGNLDSLRVKKPIPFEKEMDHVRIYLSLEQKRFKERLQVEFDIQTKDFLIPCLTLQPIVENAVRYGVTKRDMGGTVTIRTEESDSEFIIFVIDDGVGFNIDKPKQDGRSHIGIENVQKRLSLCEGKLDINSIVGVGTTARIIIPKGELLNSK